MWKAGFLRVTHPSATVLYYLHPKDPSVHSRSTCMCYARRQRLSWARIKLSKKFFESQYLDSKFVVLNYFNSKFIDWFSCLGSRHARWLIHISNIVWLCQEIFQIFFIFFSFLFAPRVKPLIRILKGAWTVKHLFQAFFIFSCRETLLSTDEGFFSPNQAFLLIEKHLIWSIFGRPSIDENYCCSATLCFCIMGINMSRFSIPMI